MKTSEIFGDRLRLVVAATFSAVALVMVPTGPAQADPGDNPGKLTTLTSSSEYAKLELQEHRVPTSSLDNLASEMGTARGVDQVLAGANHPMRNAADCSGMEKSALPLKPAAESSYCWDSGDDKTQDWLPQRGGPGLPPRGPRHHRRQGVTPASGRVSGTGEPAVRQPFGGHMNKSSGAPRGGQALPVSRR
ncbi:hypothetical protein ACFV2H_38150 [Streptomyces sp. NPDC059629]|uniref:hypothetical protein n=1 Tax=Streptomyces sp. NPDC059629 TaxID=3346889 RepID=UPI0036831E51